jgi:dTMP kinase
MDSTTVYQGFARKLGITDVDEIQNIVIGPAIPDITLFFDISPEEAKVRLDLRNSGF